MPRHATSTSFKIGNKRSKESIEKQRATLIMKYKSGELIPPKPNWNSESIAKMIEKNRKTKLINKPIGSLRISKCNGVSYYRIKISDRGKWPYEHRHVMSIHIGRGLLKSEHVHHINGNTFDNRIENLCLLSNSEHTKYHNLINPKPHSHFVKMGQMAKEKNSLNGRWSKLYNECIICHSSKNKHMSKGWCSKCFSFRYNRVHPKKYTYIKKKDRISTL